MNEKLQDILNLLDADLAQDLEGLLAEAEKPEHKDRQQYPEALKKSETSLRTRGYWQEAGQLNEAVSQRWTDALGKVQLLKRAIVMYNKAGNTAAHLRCHRAARQLVPKDLPARRRMAIWRPGGNALAYAGAGVAHEALEEIETLATAVEEWSIWERFQLHLTLGRLYLDIGSSPKAIAQGQAFVDWAQNLPDDSPELFIGDMELDGTSSRSIWGDPGRWYCLCEIFALIVVRAHIRAGTPTEPALQELKAYVAEYEDRRHKAQTKAQLSPHDSALAQHADDYRKGVGTQYAFAGWVACEGGHYAESLALLAREYELMGAQYSMGALYRAAAHIGMGDLALAKQSLSEFKGPETKDGQALKFIEQRSEFGVLDGDPDFLVLKETWS
ncbi:MAG: hypothetical protein GKR89_26265 [Candidatus Latescibacteria bacterium]|nr:hypothetical protein [Candidatus Latescibacterota bacterium]